MIFRIFRLLWIFLNCALIYFYQLLLFFALRFLHPTLYRHCMAFGIQVILGEVLSEILPLPKRLVFSGEFPNDAKRCCIILANHQVDADWWYLVQMARHRGHVGCLKFVLKHDLKHIPFIGWCMQMWDYLFLHRDLTRDKATIERQMKRFHVDQFPVWIVVFPEGTTIFTEYVEKSHAFASKSERPLLQHTILPRTSGLQILLDAAVELKPDIYDMTIAYSSYSGEIPTAEMNYTRKVDTDLPSMGKLVDNIQTESVHVHGKRYAYDQVYTNLETWIDTCWKEKDEALEEFITTGQLSQEVEEYSNDNISNKAIRKLWCGTLVLCMMSPIMIFVLFPAYLIWAVYRMIHTAYDVSTNSWIPFVKEFIVSSHSKLHQS